MNPSRATGQADRLSLRQAVSWAAFAAVLVLGVALWLRFSDRILPMLDVLTDR